MVFFFKDALQASGLTFRDLVSRLALWGPFHCVPDVDGPAAS